MGGVMIRNYHIAPRLTQYLELGADTFQEFDERLASHLRLHSEGKITEIEFWEYYRAITNKEVPQCEGSLLGKFFTPTLDEPTLAVVRNLKEKGVRVVCGTNVLDSHYRIHQQLHQYDIFDAVYPSHLLGIAKPKIDFFQRICAEEKVEPEEVFFTDDMQVNVDASLQAGLKGFLYTDAANLESQLKGLNLL
jgi:putative hydrolase of the HAD superfamily